MFLTLLPAILGLAGSLFSTIFGKLGFGSSPTQVNVDTASSVSQTEAALKTESAMAQAASNDPNRKAAVAALEAGNA